MKIRKNKCCVSLTAVLNAGLLSALIPLSAQQDQNPQPQPPPPNQPAPPQAGPGGPQGQQPGGPGRFGRFFGNFDDKQRQLLMDAMQANAPQMRELQDKLQAAQQELVKAVIAEKYDEQVVRQKAEAVAKLQVELTMLRAKAVS
ncbi:MAG: Spy/CpxP family protein refolding chaperone, partial [Limisphaerales bacterium]